MEKKQRNLLHKHTPIVSTLKKFAHFWGIYKIHKIQGVDQAAIDEIVLQSESFGHRRSRLPEQEQSPIFYSAKILGHKARSLHPRQLIKN